MDSVKAHAHSIDEARATISELVAEVRHAFADDRFAVLPRERMAAEMYAAAALAHCCDLAEHIVQAHRDGHEMVARLVARAIFESWAVGLYIHYGGVDAIEALLDYFDWEERRLEMFGCRSPRALPLINIMGELRKLTRAAGDEETFEAAYVMMFRGLSTVGAHTNIRVLAYYLDDESGRGTFVRVRPSAAPPSSMEEEDLLSALMLVTHLSQRVLGRRGCEHPVADRVSERLAALQMAAEDLVG